MAEQPAAFSRADLGLLGHYLRELRKPATDENGQPLPAGATLAQVIQAQHERAAANFCTLIEKMSGPGRYLLCALEAPALLDAALSALPALERAAFNYGLAERLTPAEIAAFNVKANTTKRDVALAMLTAFQAKLRQCAEEELAKTAGRPGQVVIPVTLKKVG